MKWYQDIVFWIYLVTVCALPVLALAISIIALVNS